MSEGQAVLDGQGLADNVIYGDGPGEVCPRRQGQPHGLPVRAGLVPAPDSEPQPVRQARSLRPQFRIMVQMTVIDEEAPKPIAHWTPNRYRALAAAELEAAVLHEEDYLPRLGAVGHVAVVCFEPGERPRMVSVRHFPEQ